MRLRPSRERGIGMRANGSIRHRAAAGLQQIAIECGADFEQEN
jgi:hypothetical protein